ncbi:Pyruvate/Phosphoenolpyruvate kinase-like domain-containing protein [Plectosphaerella plurivora]|uniref:Pyruvate/Phosphoenolpyruvate kinase-like domain-containing protein n=1 Tax=Plectosphaerella plurivora TaxID=936078 RepID=A0A9P8VLU4_9PEZI|nr:Pyruvate/Phosphoenolpyruvate kinase-like domain-containing protein [Plectosphaerella plurivora]
MLSCANNLQLRATAGQVCRALGVRLVTNPQVAQLAKNAGFDSVFIDLEHSSLSIDDAGNISNAALSIGITPFVRVPYQCGNGFVQKVMDAGAMGVIFPHVSNPSEARAAVSISKYPPMGSRSMTGSLPVFSLLPTESTVVIEESNASASSVIVMIESREAVEQAEEIAAVPGVDVLLVGSNDLAIELGVPGGFRTEVFRSALETVSKACKKNGKIMGLAGIYDQQDIHEWAINTLGVRYMLCQQDSGLIFGAGKKCIAAIPPVSPIGQILVQNGRAYTRKTERQFFIVKGETKDSSVSNSSGLRPSVRNASAPPYLSHYRRSETCVFEQDEKKVLVSERLLNDLKRKAGYQETDENAHPEKRPINLEAVDSERAQSAEAVRNTTLEPPREVDAGLGEDDDHTLRNPLVISPSKFLTDSKGRKRFLGPSSTWAYSRHVIGLLNEHLQYQESPEAPRNVDGVAFPLNLPHVKLPQQCIDLGTLPPLDYAIYLTNTVKFHIGQSYHLMDEAVFMANLFSLHNGGMQDMTSTTRLWLSQYFIIMALGKALLHRGFSKSCPFGKDYFLRGMEFLPDVSGLHDDPVLAMEVCCAIALYLQSVDHRNTAFVYLGIALRIALSQGMHHDMIDDPQNQARNSRQKSAWWTLYILDRKFSYMMGAPSQISDNAITVSLPGSPYHPPQKIAAMDVHVKLSRLIGKVIDTVYAVDGKLPASFLGIMQSTLRELAQVAETLTTSLDLNFDGSGPINRTSGTLNLCYHQVG